MGDSDEGGHFRRHGLLSYEQALNLLSHFEQSNASIARDYLGRADGRLFYDMPEAVDGLGAEEPGLSLRDAVEVSVLMWEEMVKPLEEENASLKSELQSLKSKR